MIQVLVFFIFLLILLFSPDVLIVCSEEVKDVQRKSKMFWFLSNFLAGCWAPGAGTPESFTSTSSSRSSGHSSTWAEEKVRVKLKVKVEVPAPAWTAACQSRQSLSRTGGGGEDGRNRSKDSSLSPQ